ncbi:MAG: DUF4097 family beta strand repeat-containing protein [Candidatus Polarisedimenticolia bacterium]
MLKRALVTTLLAAACAAYAATPAAVSRTVPVSSGGKLTLDLDTGGDVEISGTGGSSASVSYTASCRPECRVDIKKAGDGLRISSSFVSASNNTTADVEFKIAVPSHFDVEVQSMGGGISIVGVEGKFTGKTYGGALTLRDVRGEADLTTMGGGISLIDSDLDGELMTMGGEVLFENVVGDVKGGSMGGNVRYKNVRRRDGSHGSPPRTGEDLPDAVGETVQISTQGGEIDVEDAPDGADLHTMGGDIRVKKAERFVRAKTMGGDIHIDAVDGWLKALTMGGDIEASVIGNGGNVTLTSMSGDITLYVPAGFGMNLDLEIAFTRNSTQDYRITAPGRLPATTTKEWDREHGTPRKYIRTSGDVNGGGNTVKIRTINGNVTVREGI